MARMRGESEGVRGGGAVFGAVSGVCGVVAFQSGEKKDRTKRGWLGTAARIVAVLLLGPLAVAGYRWALVHSTVAKMPEVERQLLEYGPGLAYEDGEIVTMASAYNYRFSDAAAEELDVAPVFSLVRRR